MRIKNTEIKLLEADITQLKVEAMVNSANTKLFMKGGLSGLIKKKGGKEIEEEAVKKGPLKPGEAIYTSAGRLPSKYIIHTATMGRDFKTDELKIRQATRSALELARKLKIKSIAFPALGCGVGGFPYLASAKIMAQEILKHLREKKTPLKEIIFCLYNKEAYEIFKKGVLGYLDYIINKLQNGPFVTVDAIIEKSKSVLLVKRSNPPFGYALPGGFVHYGETLEEAVIREVEEETGLKILDLKQFHTYSRPDRDPRFHTIGTVFIVRTKGFPKAGDDAQQIKWIRLDRIKDAELAFDHKKILQDYIIYQEGRDPFVLR
ncbi:MAG: macro domain-containing protein [Candidatus Omnitrophica bacterium]|nr:macro domain-containing protein [Candidatus Omnitrophota bacterium]